MNLFSARLRCAAATVRYFASRCASMLMEVGIVIAPFVRDCTFLLSDILHGLSN